MALTIVAMLAVLVVVAVLTTRRYPFEIFAYFTRRALAKAGMTRKTAGDIVYWTGGTGDETLVLVHGANDQAGTWAAVVPELAKKYRLILPDLPGHGESAPADGPLNMRQMADGLTRVLELESNGTKVSLAGNSMGGWTSMLYTLAHPEKVRSLVLEDTGGMTWDLTGVPLVPQNRDQAASAMRAVLGPGPALPPNYVLDAMVRRRATVPMLRLMQSNVAPFLVDSRLSEFKPPVTLIWGEHDGVVPLDYARKLQSGISGAKLEIIKDCGHIPHRQKPAEFIALLEEAIRV